MDRQRKVLIVEDVYLQAFVIKVFLENLHYNVVGIAESGEEAIEMTAELHPDLVLMDIMLEGELDGIDAAKRILESSGISLIYITTETDISFRKRAEQTDYVDYLIKPISKEILGEVLVECFP